MNIKRSGFHPAAQPVYTAPTVADAERARDEFLDKWGRAYPAIKGLWLNAWEEFTPFLAYDVEIRPDFHNTLRGTPRRRTDAQVKRDSR